MEHTFPLKFHRFDDNWDHDAPVERLCAAGCGGALVGVGRPGYIALKFKRNASSKKAIIKSAQADMMMAIATALLID